MFVATVVPLHWLQPGYDAKNQLMSELALGRYGEAMLVAFAGLALAMLGAFFSRAARPRAIRCVLAAASLFFLLAGVFPLGASSEMHIAAIATAFVLSVLAMYLHPADALPRAISWSLAAGIALSVALGHSILPMGIGQRLAAACLLLWLVLLGWSLRARR